jgi:hypothetical protein
MARRIRHLLAVLPLVLVAACSGTAEKADVPAAKPGCGILNEDEFHVALGTEISFYGTGPDSGPPFWECTVNFGDGGSVGVRATPGYPSELDLIKGGMVSTGAGIDGAISRGWPLGPYVQRAGMGAEGYLHVSCVDGMIEPEDFRVTSLGSRSIEGLPG